MANFKECKGCGKVKETTEFSKRSASPDGLQLKCKVCNKNDNKKFRTEINPEHHSKWQRANKKRVHEIHYKYRRADKGGKVYYIINPEGKVYIGMTEMYLNVRIAEHRRNYRRYLKGKTHALPLLFDSFDKWGVESHRYGTLLEFDHNDRKEMKLFEKELIIICQNMGISLNKIL